MSPINTDELIKGVVAFRKTAQDELPALGNLLGKQLESLETSLREAGYGDTIDKGYRLIEMERLMREFIEKNRENLVNYAISYNPYLQRADLAKVVKDSVFFDVLKEDADLHFSFLTQYEATLQKFREKVEHLPNPTPLTERRVTGLVRYYYYRIGKVPTGGKRPRGLIPTDNVFDLDLEENYYRYRSRPFVVVFMSEYQLMGALDIEGGKLHLCSLSRSSGRPKWEVLDTPRKYAWDIHEEVFCAALDRAFEANAVTNADRFYKPPVLPTDINTKKPKKVSPPPVQKSELEIVRSKLMEMTRASYADVREHTIEIVVAQTPDGNYVDINDERATKLQHFEIPPTSASPSTRRKVVYEKLLGIAIVVNPGEAVPLKDYVKYIPLDKDRETIGHRLQVRKR